MTENMKPQILLLTILVSSLIAPSMALAKPTSDAETFFPDYAGNSGAYYEVFADAEIQNIFGLEQSIFDVPKVLRQWLMTVGKNTYTLFEIDGILYGEKNERNDFVDWLYKLLSGFNLEEAIGIKIPEPTAPITYDHVGGFDTEDGDTYLSGNYTYFMSSSNAKVVGNITLLSNATIYDFKAYGNFSSGSQKIILKVFRQTAFNNWAYIGDVGEIDFTGNDTLMLVENDTVSYGVQAGDILAVYTSGYGLLSNSTKSGNYKSGNYNRVAGNRVSDINPLPLLAFFGDIKVEAFGVLS